MHRISRQPSVSYRIAAGRNADRKALTLCTDQPKCQRLCRYLARWLVAQGWAELHGHARGPPQGELTLG